MNVVTIESNAFYRLIEMLEQVYKQNEDRNKEIKRIAKVAKTWINNEEACTLLRVSLRTMQNYRTNGIIGYSRVGRYIYYKLEDIDKLLTKHFRKAFNPPKGVKYE